MLEFLQSLFSSGQPIVVTRGGAPQSTREVVVEPEEGHDKCAGHYQTCQHHRELRGEAEEGGQACTALGRRREDVFCHAEDKREAGESWFVVAKAAAYEKMGNTTRGRDSQKVCGL